MAADEQRPKSGINFVCSSCHALIYHIGGETENKRNSSSRYPKESIFANMKKCAECGHELNFEVDPNKVKVVPAIKIDSSKLRNATDAAPTGTTESRAPDSTTKR